MLVTRAKVQHTGIRAGRAYVGDIRVANGAAAHAHYARVGAGEDERVPMSRQAGATVAARELRGPRAALFTALELGERHTLAAYLTCAASAGETWAP